MTAKTTIRCILIVLAGMTGSTGFAEPVDHGDYAALLHRHVRNGLVDYRGIQEEEALLDQYLDTLAAVEADSLSSNEKFAFYVNAYNAWTLKFILTRYPDIDSIKDLGGLFSSPWKKKIAQINGKVLTLDQIEHDILRKQFKDARVHFAVNCASMSCPPLLNEPYTGDRLDEQLNKVTRAFINDIHSNRLEGDTLWVSKIFDWFSEDFNDNILSYFIQFAEEPLKSRLFENQERIQINYNRYDWSLNKIRGGNHD